MKDYICAFVGVLLKREITLHVAVTVNTEQLQQYIP